MYGGATQEQTGTFLCATVGYREGIAATATVIQPVLQDRSEYYRDNHIQTIKFRIAQVIVERLGQAFYGDNDKRAQAFRVQPQGEPLMPILNRYRPQIERPAEIAGVFGVGTLKIALPSHYGAAQGGSAFPDSRN